MDKLKARDLLEELRREVIWQLDDCLMASLARFLAEFVANPGQELPKILKIPLEANIPLERFWPKFVNLANDSALESEAEALWPGDSGFSKETDAMMTIIDRHIVKSLREQHKKRLEKAAKGS